jgi:hypothetical protein
MRRIVLLALGLAALIAVPGATGQSSSAKGAKKAWTPSKTPDGQPDIQGFWTYATLTPLERPSELAGQASFTEQEAAEFERQTRQRVSTDRRDGGGEADVGRSYNEFWRDRGKVQAGRTSLVVDPPDGRLPAFTAEGKRLEDARVRARSGPPAGPEDRNLWERCITRGLPMIPSSYNNNFQVIQVPGYVVILSEMIHDARIIPLDSRPHLPQNVRTWMGDSRGRWEGNTLVVDTTNFSDKTSVRGSSEALHLIERFTRTDAETMQYEFTVEDPKAFTRPWKATVPVARTSEQVYEYACHEGNYALADILAGARAEEKKAAAGAAK